MYCLAQTLLAGIDTFLCMGSLFVCCPWFLIKAIYIFVIEKGHGEEMNARLHQEELPCKCINKCCICCNSYTNTSTQSCPTNASTNAVPNAVIAPQMNQPRAVMTNASTNGVNAVTSMHQHLWEPHFARTLIERVVLENHPLVFRQPV